MIIFISTPAQRAGFSSSSFCFVLLLTKLANFGEMSFVGGGGGDLLQPPPKDDLWAGENRITKHEKAEKVEKFPSSDGKRRKCQKGKGQNVFNSISVFIRSQNQLQHGEIFQTQTLSPKQKAEKLIQVSKVSLISILVMGHS